MCNPFGPDHSAKNLDPLIIDLLRRLQNNPNLVNSQNSHFLTGSPTRAPSHSGTRSLQKKAMKGYESALYCNYFLNYPFQPEPYCPQCDGVPHELPKPRARALSGVKGEDETGRWARDLDIIP
ncbi:hypothetical protein AFLA70_7g007172 [Aspergillus flavus AF70]|nr:hypothetical protein AFLA70_7g007172 [Aspergillus flavus AF70]